MTEHRRLTAEEVIAALLKARGLITVAAQRLECSPQTIHNHINRSEKVAAALKESRERVTDTAEGTLFDKIEAGEPWAVALYLKTIGKSRGYVERQEMTGADGGAVALSLATIDEVIKRARIDRD